MLIKLILPVLLLFSLLSCSEINENNPASHASVVNQSLPEQKPETQPETNEFAGKLFEIAPDLDGKTCQVVAECDCCTSDLHFLSEKDFVYNSYCMADETVVKGNYQVKDGRLILTFTPLLVTYAYNWEHETDTTAVAYFLTSKKDKIQDLTYEISKCNGSTVITLINISPNTSPEIGMENKASSNNEQIQLLKEKGIWAKLEMK